MPNDKNTWTPPADAEEVKFNSQWTPPADAIEVGDQKKSPVTTSTPSVKQQSNSSDYSWSSESGQSIPIDQHNKPVLPPKAQQVIDDYKVKENASTPESKAINEAQKIELDPELKKKEADYVGTIAQTRNYIDVVKKQPQMTAFNALAEKFANETNPARKEQLQAQLAQLGSEKLDMNSFPEYQASPYEPQPMKDGQPADVQQGFSIDDREAFLGLPKGATVLDMYEKYLGDIHKHNEASTGYDEMTMAREKAKKEAQVAAGFVPDENGIKTLHPTQAFTHGLSSTTEDILFGLNAMNMNDSQLQAEIAKKKIRDEYLYPTRTEGLIGKSAEMLGGVAPYAAASLVPGGALASAITSAGMMGMSGYGQGLYQGYVEAKQKGLSDGQALQQAKEYAKIHGLSQAALGAILPANGAAAEKILLSSSERGSLAKFAVESGLMSGEFASGQIAENILEGKDPSDNAGKVLTDGFLLSLLTHGLSHGKEIPKAVKDIYDVGIAKRFPEIEQAIHQGIKDGTIDPNQGNAVLNEAKSTNDVLRKLPPDWNAPEIMIAKPYQEKIDQLHESLKEANSPAVKTDIQEKIDQYGQDMIQAVGQHRAEVEGTKIEKASKLISDDELLSAYVKTEPELQKELKGISEMHDDKLREQRLESFRDKAAEQMPDAFEKDFLEKQKAKEKPVSSKMEPTEKPKATDAEVDNSVVKTKESTTYYHGSRQKISEWRDEPTYFSKNKEVAEGFTYQDRNDLVGEPTINEAKLEIKNPYIVDTYEEMMSAKYDKDFIKSVREDGHDGIVSKDGDSVLVFSNKQITPADEAKEPVQEKTETTIESKESDIEKRRKAELDSYSSGDVSVESVRAINAKYDAELEQVKGQQFEQDHPEKVESDTKSFFEMTDEEQQNLLNQYEKENPSGEVAGNTSTSQEPSDKGIQSGETQGGENQGTSTASGEGTTSEDTKTESETGGQEQTGETDNEQGSDTPKSDSTEADVTKGDKGISTKNAFNKADREQSNLMPADLSPYNASEAVEKAKERVDNGEVKPLDIVNEILSKTPISDKKISQSDEDVMRYYKLQLQERGRALNAERQKLATRIEENPQDETAKLDLATNQQKLLQHYDEDSRADQAMIVGGNIWSKIGQSRQTVINEQNQVLNSIRSIKTAYGDAIPEEVKKQLTDLQMKYDELSAKMATIEEKVRKADAQSAYEKRKSVRTSSKADLSKQREEIVARVKSKASDIVARIAEKSGGKTNLLETDKDTFDLVSELAPDIIDLAKNYAAEGVLKIDDVVDKISEDLKGIASLTKEHIRDSIAGIYNEKTTRSDLQKSIDDLRNQAKTQLKIEELEAGIEKEKKAKGDGSPRLEELRQELAEARKAKANEGKPTPEEKKLADFKENAQKRIDEINEKLRTGNLDPKEQNKTVLDDEAKALAEERDKLNRELAEARKEELNRKPEVSARDLKKKAEAIQRQIDRGEFFKMPFERMKWQKDPEWVKANKAQTDIKAKLKELQAQALESEKNKYMKALDFTNRWARRAIFFWSQSAYLKLSSAALYGSFLHRLPEQAVGKVWSKILPDLASKAPIEGNPNIRAEMKFYQEFLDPKKFAKNTLDIIKTGETPLSRELGTFHDDHHLPIVDLLATDSHKILKDPVKRAVFESSFEYYLKYFADNGIDYQHPLMVESARQAAYNRAMYEIFQDQKENSNAVNRFFNELEKSGIINANKPDLSSKVLGNAEYTVASLYHFFVPIATVPYNIIRRVGLGPKLPLVAAKAFAENAAIKNGIKNLTHEEADAIMVQLKKGTINAAYWTLGAALAGSIGGGLYTKYYPNKERHDVPDANVLNILGMEVPKGVQHATQLTALQLGIQYRLVYDHYVKDKGESIFSGLAKGAASTAGSMAEEIPQYGEAKKGMEALEENRAGEKFVEGLKQRTVDKVTTPYNYVFNHDEYEQEQKDKESKKAAAKAKAIKEKSKYEVRRQLHYHLKNNPDADVNDIYDENIPSELKDAAGLDKATLTKMKHEANLSDEELHFKHQNTENQKLIWDKLPADKKEQFKPLLHKANKNLVEEE